MSAIFAPPEPGLDLRGLFSDSVLVWQTRPADDAPATPRAQWQDYEILRDVNPDAPTAVRFDLSRPWPLGLPSTRDALEVLAGRRELTGPLLAAHLAVQPLMPEYALDSVLTALGGAHDPIGEAAANAWRVLVGEQLRARAFGADGNGLHALLQEATNARAVLDVAGVFTLDGGAGDRDLLAALDGAIETFVELSRFHAPTRARKAKGPQTGQLRWRPSKLHLTAVLALACAAAFHFSGYVEPERVARDWVVVGDVASGGAFLAPGVPSPAPGSLERELALLSASGVEATQVSSNHYTLKRKARGTNR